MQGIQNRQNNIKRRTIFEDTPPNFKTFCKAITHLSWVWARVSKLFSEERTIFSVNSAETTGYLHGKKEKNLEPYHLS